MCATSKNYNRFKYSLQDLKSAVEAVQEGRLSTNKACKEFNIPKGTLINRLHGKGSVDERRMGPKPVLTPNEEDRLEKWILDKAKFGFPMHEEEVKDAVKNVMIESGRPNPFTNNRPGKKWINLFLNRKKSISRRNTEIISKARASVTEADIRNWFIELENYLVEENCLDILSDGDRIYNADETGVQLCPKTGKVLGPKNYKNFYDIAVGKEKESITVLANFSASGKSVPPMIVLPYQRVPKDVSNSIPDEYFIGRSETGWMVGPTFYEYVANCFYKWLLENNIKFPVLFLLDGHKSHINPELADFCREKRILIYCLLPNATHILQPCDVGIFRPLKVNWRAEVQAYKQKTHKSLTKNNFGLIFEKAFEAAIKENTIKNSFKACGIFPFNVDNVDFSKCISNRHQKQKTEEQELDLEEEKLFLRILEKEMSPNTLAACKNIYKNNWNETDEHGELFQIWYKFKKLLSHQENFNHTMDESKIEIVENESKTLNQSSTDTIEPEKDHCNKINILQDILISPAKNVTIEIVGNISKQELRKEFDNLEPFEFIESVVEAPKVIVINQESTKCEINKELRSVTDEAHTAIVAEDMKKIEREIKLPENDLLQETVMPLADKAENKPNELLKKNEKLELPKITVNDIWNKHLHFPKIDTTKKRKIREQAPLAIVSKKWKHFHELKIKEQEMKDIEKQRRKAERELNKKLKLAKKNPIPQKRSQKRNKQIEWESSSEMSESSYKTSSEDEHETESLEDTENGNNAGEQPHSPTNANISVADFVIVEYDKNYFPGIVITTKKNEAEIRVMIKTGREHWKWPEKVDQIWYNNEKIVEKIVAPALVSKSNRVTSYVVPEMLKYEN